MKPSFIDRLLVIILCFDLVLALWCICQNFPAHAQMIPKVF